MSIVKGSFTTRIEDYSAINTGLALDVNEHRWYNNVDGYSSDQVILLIGDGVTTIANLLKYGNPTNTSEVITSSPATITAGVDHTVFVDTNTIGGSASLLVNDPTVINYRLTVVAVGAYLVNVTLTGFSVEQVPSGEARSYVWNGISWVLASGGGGGDLAGIQVPQPKTWVEKWTGNQAAVANTWGDGIYILTGIPTSDSIERTAILVIENNADVKSALVDGLLSSNNHKAFEYDSVTGTFTSWLGGVETLPITRIQRFEDDPDNLPLVTIPADPATIPGWVKEYNNPTPQITPVEYVDNDWGSGLFYFGVSYIFLTEEVRSNGIMAVEVDGIDRTVTLNVNGSSSVIVKYYGATNEFRAFAIGTDFTSVSMVAIYKWDSVSTGDLPIPVDGWETVYDEPAGIDISIVNSWGIGSYEFIGYSTNTGRHYSYFLTLDSLTQDGLGTITLEGDSSGSGQEHSQVTYDQATNSFTSHLNWAGSIYIRRIRKFNSLVNVLHSFVPDPRSVAQKDWVTKYEDSAGILTSIPLAWGAGFYRVETKDAASATRASMFINITQEAIDAGADLIRGTYSGSASTVIIVTYNAPTNALETTVSGVTHQFRKIEKYEDSQASDAPRTVLEDGWELVYDEPSGTDILVANSWGIGQYRFEYANSTLGWDVSTEINVSDMTASIRSSTASGNASSSTNNSIRYDGSGNFDFQGVDTKYFRKIWKFTGLLRIDSQVVTNTSEGSNITNAVIDTDAGDVDASSYFVDITQDRVVKLTNDGTNGNHLTGCPNGIEIGDGKTVEFYYNLGWRYQDVIIEESSGPAIVNNGSATYYLVKWAGGRFTYSAEGLNTANPHTHTMPVVDVGPYRSFSGNAAFSGSNQSRIVGFDHITTAGAVVALYRCNASNSLAAGNYVFQFEGRWKTGV